MTKPLVSILIPAYNAERWIAATLHSALAQTWPNKEIIVVDDGSSDQTGAVARQFASEGVRVVTQRNQGGSAARNTAFSVSQGEYIQWLDADDLLSPDKITRQIEALDGSSNKRTLLSSAWARFLYRHHWAKFSPTALWCDLSPAEWLVRSMSQNLHMQTATWLVSRELSEAAGPWDTRMVVDDDGEYFCRVLLNSERIRFVPEAKVYYRDTGAGSVSYMGRSNTKLEAQFLSMRLHVEYLRSVDDSVRARAACVAYLQTWLGYFYPQRLDIVAQCRQMAQELGGNLQTPRLSWKYSWIQTIFGWTLAKRAQAALRGIKLSVERCLVFLVGDSFVRFQTGRRKKLMDLATSIRNKVRRLVQVYGTSNAKRRQWNSEFAGSRWDCLDRDPGNTIYPYLEKYVKGGSILDLGCGSGSTGNELAADAYCLYTGVDISDVALAKGIKAAAENGRSSKNHYLQSDILNFVPSQQYDVILLRDSIYYFLLGNIKQILARYSRYLKEGGVFVVRFDSHGGKSKRIVDLIEGSFEIVDKELPENRPGMLVFR